DSIITLSGTSMQLDFEITLPEDIASGTYHFIAQVLDKEGNEADFTERELFLWNAFDNEAPAISSLVTVPAASGGEVHLHGTRSLDLSALLTDNAELETLELKIENEADHSTLWDSDSELSGTSYSLNETISFDAAW